MNIHLAAFCSRTLFIYNPRDMIEVYKIIANIYDSNTCQNILNFRQNKGVNLRGHQYTLETQKTIHC